MQVGLSVKYPSCFSQPFQLKSFLFCNYFPLQSLNSAQMKSSNPNPVSTQTSEALSPSPTLYMYLWKEGAVNPTKGLQVQFKCTDGRRRHKLNTQHNCVLQVCFVWTASAYLT